MKLEQYHQKLYRPDWTLQELIGRNEITTRLCGQIPAFYSGDSQDVRCISFQISSQKYRFSKSVSYLFTGAPGNGKRTTDRALAWFFWETMGNQNEEEFGYYRIPLEGFQRKTRPETVSQIEEIFHSILELCMQEQNQEKIFYFSLGNLWGLLKHKKTAHCLSKCIRHLLQELNFSERRLYPVYLTGYCHKSPSSLPDSAYNAFCVTEFPYPDKKQRLEYFLAINQKNPWCRWSMDAGEIAEKTENFTFRMLTHLAESVLAWTAGNIRNQKLKQYAGMENVLQADEHLTRYFIPEQEQKIENVPESVILFWISQIQKEIKTPKITPAFPADYPVLGIQPAVSAEPVSEPQKNPSPENEEKRKEAAKEKIQNEVNEINDMKTFSRESELLKDTFDTYYGGGDDFDDSSDDDELYEG